MDRSCALGFGTHLNTWLETTRPAVPDQGVSRRRQTKDKG
jgi:hypothetical protein